MRSSVVLLLAGSALLLATALVGIACGRRAAGRRLVYGFALATCLAMAAVALMHLLTPGAAPSTAWLPLGLPWHGAHFRLDALSAFFAFVTGPGGAAASFFALGHGSHEKNSGRVLPFYFTVPVRDAGDVDARIWIRIQEVIESLSLVERILARLPAGSVREEVAPAHSPREGIALVEGFRGDVLVWLRLDARGRIARCHLRDPSWFQWPLLKAAIEGNIVADFPLCNKSFNCSYSGHDL